jgi:hypothetical protein
MAENKKQIQEETKTELLKFTENLDNMQHFADAADKILQLIDLTNSAT